MLFTGKGITVYRLTVAKYVMVLAMKGVKMHNTARWAATMRKELGLKPRAKYSVIYDAIVSELATVVPQAQAEGGIQA